MKIMQNYVAANIHKKGWSEDLGILQVCENYAPTAQSRSRTICVLSIIMWLDVLSYVQK